MSSPASLRKYPQNRRILILQRALLIDPLHFTSDDYIRRAEYPAIYGDPALQRYALQTSRRAPSTSFVNNGHVPLKRAVANAMDKNIVGIPAKRGTRPVLCRELTAG